MTVYLSLVNHEQDFIRGATTNAVIVNDLDDSSETQKNHINRTVFTVQGDVYTNIPSCECGELTNAYNLGVRCDTCGTHVKRKLETTLEPLVWIRSPEGVAPFINPRIWYMLNEWFNKSGFSVIQYLADTTYDPQLKNQDWRNIIISDLHNRGITGRGWNYFVENFDMIIEALFSLASVRKTGNKASDYKPLHDLIIRDRAILFSRYLAMPNRSLLIIEDNDSGKWRDDSIDGVINAIRLMTGIDVSARPMSIRSKENRVVKVMGYLSEFHAKFEKNNAKKEGIWRKHVMGSRSHFSMRTVISSLTGPHHYYELHIPWGAAVSLLRYHIANKLERKKHWNSLKISKFLNKYALEYHPLLDEIFKELIAESPYDGIPVVHTRNPVLGYGSMHLMYITKVKTDTQDNTTGTSILDVVPWNLDFDGDAMHSMMTLDNYTTDKCKALESHVNGFSMNNPLEVSNNVWLSKSDIATFSNWMHDANHDQADPAKLANMMQTFNQPK